MNLPYTVSAGRIEAPEGTKVIVKSGPPVIAGVVELRVTYPEAVRVVLWHPAYRMAEVSVECSPDDVLKGDGVIVDVPQDYARLRKAAYPPIGDQLDAILKGGAELQAMQARVAGVKARFPKGR